MLIKIAVCTAAGVIFLAGCGTSQMPGPPALGPDRHLFSVDFQQDKTLRYKFVSKRQILIDFGARAGAGKQGKGHVQKMTEQMELVMAYRPVEVDTFGPATIEATCESAKTLRTSLSGKKAGKDAVKTAAGKSFRFKVTPSGIMQERSQLVESIKQLGEAAFGGDRNKGRKDPDMILDFIATQWFLWDSVSSIKRPAEGVAVGESWKSKLSVPLPIPMLVGRDTVYQLEEVKDTEAGRAAIIKSSFTLADRADSAWPMPYGGRFQMRGTFGFYRGYKLLSLSGQGTQLFNLDAGMIESDRQKYEIRMNVAMPWAGGKSGIGQLKPNMTINQEITMQLLGG